MSRPTRQAWIALGSNLGDRRSEIVRASEALARLSATPPRASSLWESPPDRAEGGAFLNAVVEIVTSAAPAELLGQLLAIEAGQGRRRLPRPAGSPSAARRIDLDLLHVRGELARGPRLTLPHPRMHERAYVLAPLAELAPELIHPLTGKRIDRLLAELACPPQKRPRIIADRIHGSASST